MKKLFALVLALCLLCTTALAGIPDYMNEDAATLPLVKEGTDITLRVVAYNDWYRGDAAPAEYLYGWKWMAKHFGVKFDVTLLDSTNRDERRNLMFASGDLPDIMVGMGLGTGDIINYGVINGQLLDLKPLLDEGIAPDASALFESDPALLSSSTTPDGAIYGLPWYWGEPTPNALNNMCNWRVFVNEKWLEAVGMESPSNAADLLAVLRAFKEADPNGVGADQIVPFNLCRNFENMFQDCFLSGYGLIGATSRYGVVLDYQDNVVSPITTEGYRDFMEFLHTCYTEGLVSADYFTMTDEQMRAINAEGRSGALADWAHYLSIEDSWIDWTCMKPLQVEGLPTTVRPGSSFSVNQGLIGADSKYPELALRVMNAFFQAEPFSMIYNGPLAVQTDDLFGLHGGEYNPETNDFTWEADYKPLNYTSGYEFSTHEIYPFNQNLGRAQGPAIKMWQCELAGVEYVEQDVFANAFVNGDLNYRWTCYNTTKDYLSKVWYPTVYLGEDEVYETTDLASQLNDYCKSETAKFITGDRSLNEWDAFQDELKAQGIERYVEIYDAAYHTGN